MLASRAELKQIRGMADLSDGQWEHLRPLVEWNQKRRCDGRGRPWSDARRVLNGVLWILRTGATLAGSAGAVRTVPDLPSPLPAVAARGGSGRDSVGTL